MPRQVFHCDPTKIYHVTNRSINKDWFVMPMDSVWRIFQEELYFIKHAFNLEILSFVLMTNHYHMLVRAPDANLSDAVAFFQAMTARRIVKDQNRINHLWAHRFKRCEISSNLYFFHAYKYIFQNPLRAGLVKRVEEYPYSSLHSMLGCSPMMIPIEFDSIFYSQKLEHYFEWVNTLYDSESEESLRLALRKSKFKLRKVKGKINPLEIGAF